MEKFLKFRLVHKISKIIHTYDTIVFMDFNSNTFESTDGNEYDLCGFDIDYASPRVDKNENDMFVGDIVKIPVLRATHQGQCNPSVWSKDDGPRDDIFLYGKIKHNKFTLEITIYDPYWGKNRKIRDEHSEPIGRETAGRTLYTHKTLFSKMEVISNIHTEPNFFDLEGYNNSEEYRKYVRSAK